MSTSHLILKRIPQDLKKDPLFWNGWSVLLSNSVNFVERQLHEGTGWPWKHIWNEMRSPVVQTKWLPGCWWKAHVVLTDGVKNFKEQGNEPVSFLGTTVSSLDWYESTRVLLIFITVLFLFFYSCIYVGPLCTCCE